MLIFNAAFAGICGIGVITEFLLPEEHSNQFRLFMNAIFCGLNIYALWVQF